MISISEWKEFQQDIKRGDVGELVYYNYLLSLYPDTSTNLFYFNEDYRYDINHHNLENHISTLHEVKTDDIVKPYTINKNLFIEYWSQGKSSGISTTESHYWVNYFLHLNQLWIISTDNLKDIIEEYTYIKMNPGKKYNKKTGKLESYGYLIPLDSCDDILNRFQIINF